MCVFNINHFGFSLALVGVLTLVGCGGSGSSGSEPITSPQISSPTPVVLQGVFVDSAVDGVTSTIVKLSNMRGTIAMAKTSNPDSATSQWFINLSNNANSLDVATNAGGFTVFGQVVGDGMQVVDAIAALTLLNGGGTFGELPIRNYSQTDVDNEVQITDDNLVVIFDIVVTNMAADSRFSHVTKKRLLKR
jgi:peptidyl-prolyl cis-trans isomerase A (cyclophilin A)